METLDGRKQYTRLDIIKKVLRAIQAEHGIGARLRNRQYSFEKVESSLNAFFYLLEEQYGLVTDNSEVPPKGLSRKEINDSKIYLGSELAQSLRVYKEMVTRVRTSAWKYLYMMPTIQEEYKISASVIKELPPVTSETDHRDVNTEQTIANPYRRGTILNAKTDRTSLVKLIKEFLEFTDISFEYSLDYSRRNKVAFLDFIEKLHLYNEKFAKDKCMLRESRDFIKDILKDEFKVLFRISSEGIDGLFIPIYAEPSPLSFLRYFSIESMEIAEINLPPIQKLELLQVDGLNNHQIKIVDALITEMRLLNKQIQD